MFTFEEFNTLAIEIEAILNSRPLTPISIDPNDLLVLTPGHFLIGDSLASLPELDFSSTPSNSLPNWQHIQKVRRDFWTRWYKESLNELNIRHKWTTGTTASRKGPSSFSRKTISFQCNGSWHALSQRIQKLTG